VSQKSQSLCLRIDNRSVMASRTSRPLSIVLHIPVVGHVYAGVTSLRHGGIIFLSTC